MPVRAKKFTLPMRKIIEDMKTHHGLKTHHRSYRFLDDISVCQEWYGVITQRQTDCVIKTCKRFKYDARPLIQEEQSVRW